MKKKKTDGDDSVLTFEWLIRKQLVRGMFRFDPSRAIFKEYSLLVENFLRTHADVGSNDALLTTILALHILGTKFATRKAEYVLVSRKAQMWAQSQLSQGKKVDDLLKECEEFDDL